MIPPELAWIREAIDTCVQREGARFADEFIYVTIRHGIVTSVDDDFWHVDGFTMRLIHRPEHNYLWSDVYPTEILAQPFTFPDDFDPLRHNLFWYIQEHADESKAVSLPPRRLACLDVYHIHRRPPAATGTTRTLIRITFCPVEIEDDSCQHNPLMEPTMYNRLGSRDFRDKLTRYGA